jgi:hypothetical protein
MRLRGPYRFLCQPLFQKKKLLTDAMYSNFLSRSWDFHFSISISTGRDVEGNGVQACRDVYILVLHGGRDSSIESSIAVVSRSSGVIGFGYVSVGLRCYE